MGKVAPFYGNQEQYKSPRQCNKPTNANLPISTFLVIIDYNINVHIVLKISVDTTSGLEVIRFQSFFAQCTFPTCHYNANKVFVQIIQSNALVDLVHETW